MALWCQAAQAGKGSHTTKSCIPNYVPDLIPHGLFCSATAGFGNFLPMTYGMPHQHSATISCKISGLILHMVRSFCLQFGSVIWKQESRQLAKTQTETRFCSNPNFIRTRKAQEWLNSFSSLKPFGLHAA